MPIAAVDYNHVRLTVSDIAVSKKFYDDVFGFEVAFELPPNPDAETKEALGFLFGGVIYKFAGGLLGLRPTAPSDDTFAEDRAGLDHLSFSVASLQDLHDAAALLDTLGIEHEPVKDLGDAGMAILEFRDPDNIALEIAGPNS
ncbi:VOC family protein [Rhodococcus sp. BP-149]|uniref:VOC family protein n=1 Tax=unclassified Rhodococcus (in: high G+C Gram-positive bacteria) TaxID=192944 RepID=UPI001C9B831B|nr:MULTISPECIES: VOC family protein [unclassified Rhodococcus (in: high G+C Gram-positive bacteria)]MBY6687897.1 VOC family protein [Rhodococcus sp. BP-288]MBY6696164.1 VOC family protein [Rhodococcus sp. BP-188]MBY6700830.1 VOC family protein [Rhodococcus sp. BP-285]MBY6701717.1 VOC family protein [Rhodococcus sp. BP-283]MBY6712718.1 VOC family protein [Rhodococcus sp. BP-160]